MKGMSLILEIFLFTRGYSYHSEKYKDVLRDLRVEVWMEKG